MAGIMIEWYWHLSVPIIILQAACFSGAIILFNFLPIGARFKLQMVQGISINLLLISFGLFITWQKDIRNDKNWFGNYYQPGNGLLIRIDEPLAEKDKSYKANGYVEAIIQNDTIISCKGKLLLYFSKDSATQQLHCGDEIYSTQNLQLIKNAGNPGEFNYEQYAIFQQAPYNVFLKEKDWALLDKKSINPFKQFIFSTRTHILSVIQKNVSNDKSISGVAEALLIGYTNDLDKNVAQAYTNTGVVHIIALSGMHLGLLYLILLWICNKIPFVRRSKFAKLLIILSCILVFAFLTGASASVFRSAIVFTCIAIGNAFDKKSSVYNSLAASAFILLCYDPYFLWDVGFQLSYLSVLSIVIFQQPIYHWFYFENKWPDKIWRLTSLTLAVQVLTFPVCIYYFHQFPVLFLVTNLVAIPLSTIILLAEIVLIILSWIPFAAINLGKIIFWLTLLLNKIILKINAIPFSVVNGLSISLLSTCILYVFVLFICSWLINEKKRFLYFLLTSLVFFILLLDWSNWVTVNQKQLVVYNIPHHQAMDLTEGNTYQFIADSGLLTNKTLQNFDCKPARLLLGLKKAAVLSSLFKTNDIYQFNDKRIILIDKPLSFETPAQKIDVDIIILSQSPKLSIAQRICFRCL
jgi:competence protein ComEC